MNNRSKINDAAWAATLDAAWAATDVATRGATLLATQNATSAATLFAIEDFLFVELGNED